VQSADFQKESGLVRVSVQGSLEDGPRYGAKHSVAGAFKYSAFTVAGVEPIQVTVDARPMGDSNGEIRMHLVSGDIDANVSLWWWTGQRTVTTLNGREIDLATYNDLFSSFQLLELLDRIRKMM
jgi:hypothetical protein